MHFLQPIFRNFWKSQIVGLITFSLIFGGFLLIPEKQKSTLYFTLQFQKTETNAPQFDPAENASKIAETIAGWAKNPSFRSAVLTDAGVEIPNFKRKISARKQNRMNVFWTVKFNKSDISNAEKVLASLKTTIESRVDQLNTDNAFPFKISPIEVSGEIQKFPWWIGFIVALFVAKFAGIMTAYGWELWRGRISYDAQVRGIFDQSPILRVRTRNPELDKQYLETFIQTFDKPRLVATFAEAHKIYQSAPIDTIDDQSEIPIILVRLGHTSIAELQNLEAIFGQKVGIVIFD